ncbi:MAG: hypothetical protein FWC69_04900, partial [Defluviitaleaceae bacterium]|nr:hypothetical protein [Defluviitaleaceae bacterium]
DYTPNAADGYISQREALVILNNTIGRTAPQNTPQAPLTFSALANILDDLIHTIISSESLINLENQALDGILIVHHTNNTSLLLSNVVGRGDVVVVAGDGGDTTLHSVNILGDIIMLGSGNPLADITIHSTTANNLQVLSPSAISLTGRSQVQNARLFASTYLETSLSPTSHTLSPNVYIHHHDVALFGRFGKVDIQLESRFAPISITADGRISYLVALGSVLLLGDVAIDAYSLPLGHVVEIASQDQIRNNMDIERAVDAAMARFVDDLLAQLLLLMQSGGQGQQGTSSSNQSSSHSTSSSAPQAPTITPPPADPSPSPER